MSHRMPNFNSSLRTCESRNQSGREETEGHQYLSFSSFKENIKEVLATPQPFTCM